MYERLKQLLDDLNEMGKHPFIGYGNPDARILIIGKECAIEDNRKEGDSKSLLSLIVAKIGGNSLNPTSDIG